MPRMCPEVGGDRSVRSRREVEKPEPRTVRCGTVRFVDRQSEVHRDCLDAAGLVDEAAHRRQETEYVLPLVPGHEDAGLAGLVHVLSMEHVDNLDVLQVTTVRVVWLCTHLLNDGASNRQEVDVVSRGALVTGRCSSPSSPHGLKHGRRAASASLGLLAAAHGR